jgi:hypothetical protein
MKIRYLSAFVMAAGSAWIRADVPATGTVRLDQEIPWQGPYAYIGVYPTLGSLNGHLTAIHNTSVYYLRFPKYNRTTADSDSPQAVVFLGPNAAMSASDIGSIYGMASPGFPLRFVACIAPPLSQVPSSVFLTIDYTVASSQPSDPYADGPEQVVCSVVNSTTTNCRIDRPNVRERFTWYPQIRFQPGDTIKFDAGGCVNRGGSGLTWTRYVDPVGPASDRLYHGLIWLPGTGYQRPANEWSGTLPWISLMYWNTYTVPRNHDPNDVLVLGYEDGDNAYGDNEEYCIQGAPVHRLSGYGR